MKETWRVVGVTISNLADGRAQLDLQLTEVIGRRVATWTIVGQIDAVIKLAEHMSVWIGTRRQLESLNDVIELISSLKLNGQLRPFHNDPQNAASRTPRTDAIQAGARRRALVDAPQPTPTANDRPVIQDLVATDLVARKEHGLKKYGTLLQPFNGRDAARDAYEESLDQTQYLRQLVEEWTEIRQLLADCRREHAAHCNLHSTMSESWKVMGCVCGADALNARIDAAIGPRKETT